MIYKEVPNTEVNLRERERHENEKRKKRNKNRKVHNKYKKGKKVCKK